MVLVDPKKSWKHGTGFCEGEFMEVAFLIVFQFCVQVAGPPRCGYVEDERGPYATEERCRERVQVIMDFMKENMPPGSFVAQGSCVKIEGEKT